MNIRISLLLFDFQPEIPMIVFLIVTVLLIVNFVSKTQEKLISIKVSW